MKTNRTKATFLGLVAWLLIGSSVNAQALDVDWKYYGSSQDAACFFNAQGVERNNRHLRVWTKCLRQSELDGVDVSADSSKMLLEATAQKIAKYYEPPISSTQTLNADQRLAITTYEVEANLAGLEPQARIFYEIDCEKAMLRELSISIKLNGKRGTKNTPSEWQYMAPESNGHRLLKIVCKVRK